MLELKSSADKLFSWNGVEYKMRMPKTIEVMEFTKAHSEFKKDQAYEILVLMIDYLDKLGLPKAVAYEMEMSHITALSNYLNGTESQGK